jgi:hypothetical protein
MRSRSYLSTRAYQMKLAQRASPTVKSKCRARQHRWFRFTKGCNLKGVTHYRIFAILDERSEHKHGWLQMEQLLERARAYLDGLEADRQAALTLSEQKAEEAKLIKARQEGFRAAMEMLGGEIATGDVGTDPHREEQVRRRGRRSISKLILRELAVSGDAMTTVQIAGAIDYIRERTETALERMEKDGRVLRNEGRWTIATTPLTQTNGDGVRGNRRSQSRKYSE